MPAYKRPGVYVEEVLSPSYAFVQPSLSAAAFVGQVGRGPAVATTPATTPPTWQGVPTVVQSWSDYVSQFGAFEDPTLFLPMAVYAFFNNGGRRAWISRCVGASAAAASRTLSDRQATPAQTLQFTAANPGAWANSIYIDIVDRAASSGRFDVIIRYGGTSDANIVERWVDVTMVATDSKYVVNIINNPVVGSHYVTVVDMGSTGVFPANTPAVTTGSQQLAGGADGSVISSTDISNSIKALDVVLEPFNLNLPGNTSSTDISTAVNYADPAQGGRGDVFVVVDPPSSTPASLLISSFLIGLPVSSYSALYYPWVQAVDPASSSPGALRKLPPGGFVLGKYADTDASRGVFKAPAGINTRLNSVAGLEFKLTNTDLDNLNINQVNAIRNLPGSGVVIMGARTLKNTPQTDRYIPVRRSLIYLKQAFLSLTQYAIFEPNDQILWQSLTNTITQFLLSFWQSGGLAGARAQEAFYVKCDADNNTPQTVSAGEVHVEVGVALQSPAEFIVIRIGQWQGGQQAVVIQ